jgi:hypothetical protein
MGTSAKSNAQPSPPRPAKRAAASRAKTGAKSAASPVPASAEPCLRFYHSQELRARTHAVLGALESSSDHESHRVTVADLVAELTEAGMDYYYLRALRLAQVGFVVEQSARLGVSGAAKLISSVSRKFILRMDRAQLLAVARHIRELA